MVVTGAHDVRVCGVSEADGSKSELQFPPQPTAGTNLWQHEQRHQRERPREPFFKLYK